MLCDRLFWACFVFFEKNIKNFFIIDQADPGSVFFAKFTFHEDFNQNPYKT